MDKLRSFIPLNFDLMANPVNWVIVTLMVLLAGFAMAHIFSGTTKDSNPAP